MTMNRSIKFSLLCVLITFSYSLQTFGQKRTTFDNQVKPFQFPKVEKKLVPTSIEDEAETFYPQSIVMPELDRLPVKFNLERTDDQGRPEWINMYIPIRNQDAQQKADQIMSALQSQYPTKSPHVQWKMERSETDELNITHWYFQQFYNNIPIYYNESVLHSKPTHFFLWNGKSLELSERIDLQNTLTEEEALEKVKIWYIKEFQDNFDEMSNSSLPMPEDANRGKQYIYKFEGKNHLVWKFNAMPNALMRYEVFVDAHSGKILDYFKNTCSTACSKHCDGHHSEDAATPPNTTNGRDLLGVNRTLETYSSNGRNYMIDASRSMFNASASNIPNDPVGVIWTLNARNTFPNNSFNPAQITTSSSSWNNPTAVSAHYNAGKAFEYFQNTHGRNSIDGRGGRIVSYINVSDQDGSDMDNAFWTGVAMFYGNGATGFSSPLSRSLDVAGHEMSHGVIQNSANLEYRDESGALNESFADVFGVMMDRNDWQLGEDVVNSSVFRTGYLRDMSNPNNGGNSLNDAGYQPDHYNQRYTGSQDNGGVHINSGIPNFAFFKIASDIGKTKAEKIFYRALTRGYLTRSSRFIDFRSAIAQSAEDLYGNTEVTACHRACDEVGIPGRSGGGGTDPQDYQNDLPVNPGNEFLVLSDENRNDLFQLDANGNRRISLDGPRSKPSITDNGREITYVNNLEQVNYLSLNYNTGEIDEFLLINSPEWKFVAFSKDGSKLAGVRNVQENKIWVYDFNSRQWKEFDLYNPSYSEGINAGDVLYADALEWDYSGEYIMYDAYNELRAANGANINYWDIGFIKVWDKGSNNFDRDGEVSKLFPSLPEGVSIGNPSFSKNSPYIIAFDLIDSDGTNYLIGANLETSTSNAILSSDRLFYPSYGLNDALIYFDYLGSGGNNYRVAAVELNNDKISAAGNVLNSVNGARWGVIHGNGVRDLTSSDENVIRKERTNIYPNPFRDFLKIELLEEASVEIKDMLGRTVLSKRLNPIQDQGILATEHLESGSYFLIIESQNDRIIRSIIKQ